MATRKKAKKKAVSKDPVVALENRLDSLLGKLENELSVLSDREGRLYSEQQDVQNCIDELEELRDSLDNFKYVKDRIIEIEQSL